MFLDKSISFIQMCLKEIYLEQKRSQNQNIYNLEDLKHIKCMLNYYMDLKIENLVI